MTQPIQNAVAHITLPGIVINALDVSGSAQHADSRVKRLIGNGGRTDWRSQDFLGGALSVRTLSM